MFAFLAPQNIDQIWLYSQAAEKVLKAALYLEDRDAAQSYQSGSQCHSLTAVAQQLSCSSILSLARDMECHVGHHTYMRYPTSLGVPCDRYAQHDAEFMLEKAADLMKTLKPRFPSLWLLYSISSKLKIIHYRTFPSPCLSRKCSTYFTSQEKMY